MHAFVKMAASRAPDWRTFHKDQRMNSFALQLSSPQQRFVLTVASLLLLVSGAHAAGNKTALEMLPDDGEPAVTVTTPAPRAKEITQTSEQNAVTSVRVREGNNIYYVKPGEQSADGHGGVRGAQWQIFEFKSKDKPNRSNNGLPPPPQR